MRQKNDFNVPPPAEEGTRELRKEIQKMKRDNRFLRMRLATNMARKQALQDTLRNTAVLVRQVGQTPVVNAADATSKTTYGLTACARSCGTTLGRLYKWLQHEGVMHRESDIWVIDEPYQDNGCFLYLFGMRNCYRRLYLRITPKGLDLIRKILASHPIEERYFKRTKKE